MVQKDHELQASMLDIGLDFPGVAAHINQAESYIQHAEESLYVW